MEKNRNELVIETYSEASAYIKKVLAGIDFVVENFTSGQEDAALNSFVNLLDGINWLVEVIGLTKPEQDSMGISFTSYDVINNNLDEMAQALENKDYVLIGDLLNFELKPVIEEWENIFQIISKRIKAN